MSIWPVLARQNRACDDVPDTQHRRHVSKNLRNTSVGDGRIGRPVQVDTLNGKEADIGSQDDGGLTYKEQGDVSESGRMANTKRTGVIEAVQSSCNSETSRRQCW